MVNIFNKLIISMDDFFNLNIEWDLFYYLYNNLDKQNYITFRLDLSIALTTNANG